MAPYQASGLGSGLDTLSIIDQFVALQQQPIQAIQKKKASVQTQISGLGNVNTKIATVATTAAALGTKGVRTVSVQGTNASFSTATTSASVAGRYAVKVDALATAAKFRSGAFASTSSTVAATNLSFTVAGATKTLAVAANTTLTDLATQINAMGAGVTASLMNAGSGTYLSIEANDTGFPLTGNPADALQIGDSGNVLGLSPTQVAANGQITVDGLAITRRTNTYDDVLPGSTITATTVGAAETLVIGTDLAASTKKVQDFVDAMNDAFSLLDNMTVNTTTRKGAMAGDSTLRDLRSQLNRLAYATVPGLTGVSTLGDLGVMHDKYGNLTFDSSKLQKAITTNPASVDAFFTKATTGMAALVKAVTDRATTASTGSIAIRTEGLQKVSTDYDKQIERMNRSVEAYKAQLTAQFTAMETTVGSLKKIGSYLTQMANQKANNS